MRKQARSRPGIVQSFRTQGRRLLLPMVATQGLAGREKLPEPLRSRAWVQDLFRATANFSYCIAGDRCCRACDKPPALGVKDLACRL